MKGIVVHYQGRVRRAVGEGRGKGRLGVRVIYPVPAQHAGAGHGINAARPVCFVFELDGRVIASSRNVTLTKGRRYPEVEHWFVMPEHSRPGEAQDLRQDFVAAL